MKFYHGSPKKLEVLKPQQAKGMDNFQNKKAIFLTRDFNQAALYALAKSLKGKTRFALPPGKVVILGDYMPIEEGYVYEIGLDEKDVQKGNKGEYEFAYTEKITSEIFKRHRVFLKDYEDKIKNTDNEEEFNKEVFNK